MIQNAIKRHICTDTLSLLSSTRWIDTVGKILADSNAFRRAALHRRFKQTIFIPLSWVQIPASAELRFLVVSTRRDISKNRWLGWLRKWTSGSTSNLIREYPLWLVKPQILVRWRESNPRFGFVVGRMVSESQDLGSNLGPVRFFQSLRTQPYAYQKTKSFNAVLNRASHWALIEDRLQLTEQVKGS